MSQWNFHLPTQVRFGPGRLEEIKDVVQGLGGKRVFLVTGRRAAKATGLLDRTARLLSPLEATVFAEAEENPSIATVDRGAEACRQAGAEVVVGLGGGSAIDAAKAMAMLQANPGSIREYLDGEKTCQRKGLPLVAVPTTSGTGTEVTPFAVITHPAKKAKPAVAPAQMFPDVAIVDPELTASLPRPVAVSAGLDALCQAVEGFWSTRANALTRALSGQGIVLAMRHLRSACLEKDPAALEGLTLASHLTGIQMSHVANTVIHPLSYPFTLDHAVPHGFACAVFLPAFLRFNAEAVAGTFRDPLAALGLGSVHGLAAAIETLMKDLGAPRSLGDFGVTADELPELVRRGRGKSWEWNPRPLAEADVLEVCRGLL